MNTASKFMSQSGKINNKLKQTNNKQDKLKFNLPKEYFD